MVSWLELSTPGHRAPMLRSERAPLFHPDVSPQVRPTPRTLFHISLLTQSSGLALVLSDVNICTVWTDVKYCRKNNKWIQFEDPPDVWETSGRSGDSLVELLFYKNINTGRWQFSSRHNLTVTNRPNLCINYDSWEERSSAWIDDIIFLHFVLVNQTFLTSFMQKLLKIFTACSMETHQDGLNKLPLMFSFSFSSVITATVLINL